MKKGAPQRMPESNQNDYSDVTEQQREVQEALMNMPEFSSMEAGIEETKELERATFDIQPPED